MFLTAQTIKLHDIGKHKAAALLHGLTCYHETVRLSLAKTAADAEIFNRAIYTDKNGKQHVNGFGIGKVIRPLVPKGIAISMIRTYATENIKNMLLSYYNLRKNGHEANLPTLPELREKSDDEIGAELEASIDAPLATLTKEQEARLEGFNPKRRERMRTAYQRRALQKKVDAILRSKAKPLPLPIEFTHYMMNNDFKVGFLLAVKGGSYFFLCRIFSKGHRYCQEYTLQDGFADAHSGESLAGRKVT